MTIDERRDEHEGAAAPAGATVHLFVPRSARSAASRADDAAAHRLGHEPTDHDDGPGPSAA